MNNILENYFACIYLGMIGDKIGFNDGQGERNNEFKIYVNKNEEYDNELRDVYNTILYMFIENGGIIGFNIDNKLISDDTIMHMDTIHGLNSDFKNKNELYNNITNNYLDSFKNIDMMKKIFLAGRQTIESIININSGVDWKKFIYNKNAGGSGGPMRTMAIGLAFNYNNDLLKLIESSIMITSITHPNCLAFIGSIASAIFTSYAINQISLELWIFEFLLLLESDIINNIIEKIKPNYIEFFEEDKKEYIFKIKTYIETSFDNYTYIVNQNAFRSRFQYSRISYYYENFSSNKKIIYPGSGADDCIIIAYDCLLLSKNNYEKLIYTSMVSIGDTDTVGSIASAWYGALYGFNNVPTNLLNKNHKYYIEFKEIAEKIYNKFYQKKIINF